MGSWRGGQNLASSTRRKGSRNRGGIANREGFLKEGCIMASVLTRREIDHQDPVR
jgi:hypothetical protein